jgi:hypothetical protein
MPIPRTTHRPTGHNEIIRRRDNTNMTLCLPLQTRPAVRAAAHGAVGEDAARGGEGGDVADGGRRVQRRGVRVGVGEVVGGIDRIARCKRREGEVRGL